MSKFVFKPGEWIGPRYTEAEGYPVVAVIGEAGDWAAYQGGAGWTFSQIAHNGDKISQSQAEKMFPEIKKSGLRWRD